MKGIIFFILTTLLSHALSQIYVNFTAGAGGSGTLASPFGTLAEALAAPSVNTILILPSGPLPSSEMIDFSTSCSGPCDGITIRSNTNNRDDAQISIIANNTGNTGTVRFETVTISTSSTFFPVFRLLSGSAMMSLEFINIAYNGQSQVRFLQSSTNAVSITVTDSVFADNTISDANGLFTCDVQANLSITGSTFANNLFSGTEGSVIRWAGPLIMTTSNFADNICDISCLRLSSSQKSITSNSFYSSLGRGGSRTGSPGLFAQCFNGASFEVGNNFYCGLNANNIDLNCGSPIAVTHNGPDNCGICGGTNQDLDGDGQCFSAVTGTRSTQTITVNPAGGANATDIQTAINMAENGDTIQLMPGTYQSTGNSDLVLPKFPITIQANDDVVINFTNTAFINSNSINRDLLMTFPRPSLFTVIRGITISGMGSSAVLTNFFGTGITFERVIFQDFSGANVMIARSGAYPRFVNCQFINNLNIALLIDASSFEVTNSSFVNVGTAVFGRSANQIRIGRLIFTNNFVVNANELALDFESALITNPPYNDYIITGNSFSNISSTRVDGIQSVLCQPNRFFLTASENRFCDSNVDGTEVEVSCTDINGVNLIPDTSVTTSDICGVCTNPTLDPPECSIASQCFVVPYFKEDCERTCNGAAKEDCEGTCNGPAIEDSNIPPGCCLTLGSCGDCVCTSNSSDGSQTLLVSFVLLLSILVTLA